jgi:hypothetical protein
MHNFLIILWKNVSCIGTTLCTVCRYPFWEKDTKWPNFNKICTNIRHLDFKAPMEELDQGSLHPSTKHPETVMSGSGFDPSRLHRGGYSTKELCRQLTHLTILVCYMAQSHTLNGSYTLVVVIRSFNPNQALASHSPLVNARNETKHITWNPCVWITSGSPVWRFSTSFNKASRDRLVSARIRIPAACVVGGVSSEELSRQLTHLNILIFYTNLLFELHLRKKQKII